ncbi:MAG: hypothetical protein JO013_09760 [Alphaproteobacteria bacterium]|nr:hypothetical protein [Alphaproteobacteria bacterium]
MKKLALAAAALAVAAAPAAAKDLAGVRTLPNELTIYHDKAYSGESYDVRKANSNLELRWDAGSLSLQPGDVWEVCARPMFKECVTVSQSVADAASIGVTGEIKSARLKKKDK